MKTKRTFWLEQISRRSALTLLLVSLSAAASQLTAQVPSISTGGIVSAADYSAAVAPGAMMSIFGTNLAPGVAEATTIPLPTELNGVKVQVIDQGRSAWAALFFISAEQINAQLPFGLSGGVVQVRVWRGQNSSIPAALTVAQEAPRLFTRDTSGQGEAILVHSADWSLVTEQNPAVPGEYVILFLTGLGGVTPAAATGAAGGDNAGYGPVNYCLVGVTATVGGEDAPVVFAGLAPQFVGLYQMNLQMPTGLGEGEQTIVVRAGAATSQASVHLFVGTAARAPEEVVGAALEAQAAGDVEGMLSWFALDHYTETGIAKGREALGMLRDGVTFTNFRFTPVATSIDEAGGVALVRAEASYTMSVSGQRVDEVVGLFALLVGSEGEWKILVIGIDDLLNGAIHERLMNPEANLLRFAGEPMDDYTRTNSELNRLLATHQLDGRKLASDVGISILGKLPDIVAPGVNDATAIGYEIADSLKDIGQAADEFHRHGLNRFVFLHLTQAAWGGVQIVFELEPLSDAATDGVGILLEQTTFALEMKRTLADLKDKLAKTSLTNPASFYAVPDTAAWKYPAGVKFAGGEFQTAYGRDLVGISLEDPWTIHTELAFKIIRQISTSYNMSQEIANALRAVQDTFYGDWLIPLDVTAAVDLKGIESKGDDILQNFRRGRIHGIGKVLVADTTCLRGYQIVKTTLVNGGTVRDFQISNRYMDSVTRLDIQPLQDGKLKVGEGGTLEFVVLGVPGGTNLASVEIPSDNKCIVTWIEDTAIADLVPGNVWKLAGESAGETTLSMFMGAPTQGERPDIILDTPVQVSAGLLPLLQQTTFLFSNVGGLHKCEDSETGPSGIAFGPMSNVVRTTEGQDVKFPIQWTGGAFTVSGEVKDANSNEYELNIKGQLAADARKLITAQFELLWKQDFWEKSGNRASRVTRFTLSNLPLTWERPALMQFDYTAENTAAVAAASGLYYEYLYETGKTLADGTEVVDHVNTCTYSESDWATFPPEVHVSFRQQ